MVSSIAIKSDIRRSNMFFRLVLFITSVFFQTTYSQLGGGDRTNYGIGNCREDASVLELIEPLKKALARMITRHCRNTSACRLRGPVEFSEHQIVLFDGYPRRENRAIYFRFFIVLPYNAVPIEKKIEKPLLSSKILADMLKTQHSEFSNSLGWSVVSYEKFPRFDPITTFMNRALIPIGVVAALFMLFLAYWSSTISSSTYAGGEGWMVSGSTGGKNAAYRRTLEIIEEQKLKMGPSPSESLKKENVIITADGNQQRRRSEVILDVNKVSFDETKSFDQKEKEHVPEIVIFQPRDSTDSESNFYGGRMFIKHSRRPSVIDEYRREKRKSRNSIFGSRGKSRDAPKKWKAGSMMLSKF